MNNDLEQFSVEYLWHLFDYEELTGRLIWKNTLCRSMTPGREAKRLNNRGYYAVMIGRKNYSVHRVVFYMKTGRVPKLVDHINNNRTDNRWINLREVSDCENAHNTMIRSDNKSGVKGVSWDKRRGNWKAEIQAFGKRVFIGSFNDLKEADRVMKEARQRMHGQYANHGNLPAAPKPESE